MISNPIIFYISSFIIVIFTILALCSKNIINSLLSSVMVFFAGALFFYTLGSEYNAIIQTIVYGISVPVIIGLSIMFTDKFKNKESEKKIGKTSYITILCSGIFMLAFVYIIMISLVMLPDTFNIMELNPVNSYDVISSFARGIFIDYVWAFELVSLLLTVVIAGLTLFRKKGA